MRYLMGMAHDLPGLLKYLLVLPFKDGRIGVEGTWKRPRLFDIWIDVQGFDGDFHGTNCDQQIGILNGNLSRNGNVIDKICQALLF